MKIKDGFILRVVAGTNLVVAVGERSKEYNRMIKLNDTGKFLWELLKEETSFEALASAMIEKYEIDEALASRDLAAFLDSLRAFGALEE